jgi:hypothetical protein
MSTFTAAAYLSAAGRTVGEEKTAFEDNLQATKQIPGAGVAETTLVINTGGITPSIGSHRVDTEGFTATDDLFAIAQTALPDGSMLLLRPVTASRTVVLKHAGGGAGQLSLKGSADLTLRHPLHWVLLKRTGAQWEEVERFGFARQQRDARLEYTSATVITLQPGVIPLNVAGMWLNREIPDAGITKTNAGLTANTFYYVYASASGATVVLTLSPTAPILSDGVWVVTGDPAFTLVGAVRTTGATPGQFQSTGSINGVASWFNRKLRAVTGFDASTPITSASPVPVGAGASFIRWLDDYADLTVQANLTANAVANVSLACHLDATSAGTLTAGLAAGGRTPATVRAALAGPTTFHTLLAHGATTAGTATFENIQEVAVFMG